MRRNGFKIMWGLLGLVKPLAHIMVLCITMGTLGYLCATAITVLAANLLLTTLEISPLGPDLWRRRCRHAAVRPHSGGPALR